MKLAASFVNSEFISGTQLQGSKKPNKLFAVLWKYRTIYIMMLPGLLLILVFRYLPMFGIVISFQDYKPWDGILKSEWVGLRFFQDALRQDTFLRAFRNTVLISFVNLAIGFPAPIILALLLNEVRNKVFKRSVQTISYLPFFLSWVIIASFVFNMFSSDYGYVNKLLVSIGLSSVDWYFTMGIWRWLLVLFNIWKGVGWGTIIYLGAITSINPELYESAVIDGCSRFKRVIHITLPGLAPTIVILLILNAGSLVAGNFEQIWALLGDNKILAPETDIIDTFVYRVGILESKYSFGAAVGLFRSVVSAALVYSSNKLSRKFQEEENYTLF